MVVDAKKRIHIVWPTLITESAADRDEPTIALFYAMSADGKTFTARERIPTEGMPHHPRLAVGADGSLTVAWDEAAGGSRRIAVARGGADDAGHPRFRREALTPAARVYPALAVPATASSSPGRAARRRRRRFRSRASPARGRGDRQ